MKKHIIFYLFLMLPRIILSQDINNQMEEILEKKNQVIDSLKLILKKDSNNVDVLNNVIKEYLNLDKDSTAYIYSGKLFKIQKRTEDQNKIAKIKLLKAEILFRLKKEKEAIKLLNENLNSNINEIIIAKTHDEFSKYYSAIGNFEKSMDYIHEKEKIYLKNKDSLGLVNVYSAIARTYLSIDKKKESIQYFEKASQFVANETAFNRVRLPLNVALISSDLLDFDKALKKMKEAEKIAYEEQMFKINPQIFKIYGIIYNRKKEYQKSLDYFLRSLRLSKKTNLGNNYFASVYRYTGENYYHLKEYSNAIHFLEKTYKLDTYNINIMESDAPIYENELVNSYSKKGNYKKAFETLIKFSKISDSINVKKQNIKIIEITEKYENEKKELQIIKLNNETMLQEVKLNKQKSTIYIGIGVLFLLLVPSFIAYKNYMNKQKLKEASLRLDKVKLQQRFLRMQLNPHFFFHALSSIESYIYKGEKEQAAGFLQNFSKLMRNILESSDLDFIPLQDDINFIKRYLELQRLNNEYKFNYTITIDEDVNTLNTMIPPMITQPFVENAIIHGALEVKNGMVNITFSKNSDNLIISIVDNGQKHLQTSQDSKKINRSMSTGIVKQRIENLKKVHDYDIIYSVLNNSFKPLTSGTTITFILPIKHGNFKL